LASRITLEVTDVRVERVQEITNEDAEAEGAYCASFADKQQAARVGIAEGKPFVGAIDYFRQMWDSINAKRGYLWADDDLPDNLKTGNGRVMYGNPWVWVINFKRLEEAR
jgi:hypothetical protein